MQSPFSEDCATKAQQDSTTNSKSHESKQKITKMKRLQFLLNLKLVNFIKIQFYGFSLKIYSQLEGKAQNVLCTVYHGSLSFLDSILF